MLKHLLAEMIIFGGIGVMNHQQHYCGQSLHDANVRQEMNAIDAYNLPAATDDTSQEGRYGR